MADKELILSKIKLYIHHPISGQLFADIFPIFRDPAASEAVVSNLVNHIKTTHDLSVISSIVCLESRGFFIGPLIASRLSLPCIPVRKAGKLPGATVSTSYLKDYGPDTFEMKTDAFEGIETLGKKVILVDDLLGMGGSILAAKSLVEKLGEEVAEAVFIFDVDVPVYREAVERNLGGLRRYSMITLGQGNLSPPIDASLGK